MKSADDIIIQKEWQELSDEEKSIVAGIAASEKEYNLIKKMLQVSAAELTEVPQLNAELFERIKAAHPFTTSTTQWKKWLAAAAVVAAILTFFVIKNPAKEESYVRQKPEGTPIVSKKDTPVSTVPAPIIVKQSAQKNNYPAKSKPLHVTVQSQLNPADSVMAFAAVTVAEDARLLDLIAEAE